MNEALFRLAFWVWLAEIGLSGVNFFLLMNRVYEPRLGSLRAHQIGMATRIAYIFAFAGYLVTHTARYSTVDLVYVGLFWLG